MTIDHTISILSFILYEIINLYITKTSNTKGIMLFNIVVIDAIIFILSYKKRAFFMKIKKKKNIL